MSKQWNEAQALAINTLEGNILVSASAGTGKTSAMIERVMESIRRGALLREILIVTYTEKSAADMKEKLKRALTEYLEVAPDERKEELRDELDLLSLASVGTMDSFCLTLIKRYFERLDLSPLVSVIDSDAAEVLRNKALDAVLEEFATHGDLRYDRLCSRLNLSRRDDKLKAYISKAYDFVLAHAEKEKWFSKFIENCERVDDHVAIMRMVEIISKKAKDLGETLSFLILQAQSLGLDKLCKRLFFLYGNISPLMNAKTYSDLYLADFSGTKPPYSPMTAAKEETPDELYDRFLTADSDYDSLKKLLALVTPLSLEEERCCYCEMSKDAKLVESMVVSLDKRYGELKRQKECVDFDDLKHLVVKLLSDDEVADEIAESYKYIYIDEYQDANDVQEYIFSRISRNNNFSVGDVKQSIYRFRQASPEIMLNKSQRYSKGGGGKELRFNVNYRSNRLILDYVNGVFSAIMRQGFGGENYSVKSLLSTSVEYQTVSTIPIVNTVFISHQKGTERDMASGVYSLREDSLREKPLTAIEMEAIYVSRKILEMVGREKIYIPEKQEARLIRYSDIMILFRKRSKASAFLDILSQADIPLQEGDMRNNSNNKDVDALVTVIRLIRNSRDDVSLIGYLRSPLLMCFTDEELAEIRRFGQGEFYNAARLASQSDTAVGNKLKRAFAILDDLRFCSGFQDIAALLERLILLTDYELKLTSSKNGKKRFLDVMAFISQQKGKAESQCASDFLEYYDRIKDKLKVGGGVLDDDAVRVMTMHASKGLESPIVFVVAASDSGGKDIGGDITLDNAYGLATKYYFDEQLAYVKGGLLSAIAYLKKRQEKEEAMRLLYVALTRAENHLFVVGESTKLMVGFNADDAKSFSEWILYSARNNELVRNTITNINAEELDFYVRQKERRIWSPKSPCQEDIPMLDSLRDSYLYEYPHKNTCDMSIKYSVSEINSIADEEVNIPSLYKDDSTERGLSYHKLLEHLDFCCSTKEELERAISELVCQKIFSEEEAAQIDRELLVRILNTPLMKEAAKSPTQREKPFMLYVEADKVLDTSIRERVLVQGSFDLLILGEQPILVDYKSSRLDKESLKDKYSKQVELYAYAAEQILGVKLKRKVIFNILKVEVIDI